MSINLSSKTLKRSTDIKATIETKQRKTKTNESTLLGSVYACIAGDHRYSTMIELRASDASFDIVVRESGAAGGMDSDGGAYELPSRLYASLVRGTRAVDIMRSLRRAIQHDRVVSKYGKASKRFEWRINDERALGLSVALCARAVEALRTREIDEARALINGTTVVACERGGKLVSVKTTKSEQTLHDALAERDYTHRPSAAVNARDIVDASGVVVYTGSASETWAWLRRRDRAAKRASKRAS